MQGQPKMRVGAVLTFAEGTTLKQVREALAKLGQDVKVSSENVQQYDARYGSPVFYIP